MMAAVVLSVRTGTPPNVIDEVIEGFRIASNIVLLLLLISDVQPQRGNGPKDACPRSPPRMSGL